MQSPITFTALAGVCFLFGCHQPAEREPSRPAVSESGPQIPAVPVIEPALDREALLLATMQAASRSWLGVDDRERQRELDGKPFVLRLRFGCGGAAVEATDEGRSWRFDQERRLLTFKVASDISKDAPAISSLDLPQVEAAEGFWIERPWVFQAACPPASGGEPVVDPSAPLSPSAKRLPEASQTPIVVAPKVAIAQFYNETDTRTHRRDSRAYQATKTLDEGSEPSPSGYDLVISGRLRRLDDGRVIACKSSLPTTPPSCVISARFDSVAIEWPAGGGTIATWSGA